jgi:hypothetical protein
MEAIGLLAFIHEHTINQLTYCDIQGNGTIIILKHELIYK